MAEGDRRLRCCHPNLGWGRKAWFLTALSIQMMDCGHSANFRDVVVSRVVARYQESLRKHQGGERPLYRTREEREKACEEAGGRPGRSDWFRECGASTVISVPATDGSKLASKVREALAAAPDPTGGSLAPRSGRAWSGAIHSPGEAVAGPSAPGPRQRRSAG